MRTSHLFDLTLCEFLLIDKKLDITGIIGFHDLWMPSLRKLLSFILSNRHYEFYSHTGDTEQFYQGNNRGLKNSFIRLLARSSVFRKLINPQLLFDQIYSIPNMIFLQKKEIDKRNWTYHNDF
jgi:hypothetical protein